MTICYSEDQPARPANSMRNSCATMRTRAIYRTTRWTTASRGWTSALWDKSLQLPTHDFAAVMRDIKPVMRDVCKYRLVMIANTPASMVETEKFSRKIGFVMETICGSQPWTMTTTTRPPPATETSASNRLPNLTMSDNGSDASNSDYGKASVNDDEVRTCSILTLIHDSNMASTCS
jgi:hypothetical protein